MDLKSIEYPKAAMSETKIGLQHDHAIPEVEAAEAASGRSAIYLLM